MLSVLADVGGLMAGGLEGAWFVVFLFLLVVWSVVYTLISTLFTSYVSFLTPLTSLKCPREIGSALNVIVSGQILSIQWFLIFQFKIITFFFYLFCLLESCVCFGLCYVWLDVHFQLGASRIFGSQAGSNPNFTHWNNQLWHFLLFLTVNYREFCSLRNPIYYKILVVVGVVWVKLQLSEELSPSDQI